MTARERGERRLREVVVWGEVYIYTHTGVEIGRKVTWYTKRGKEVMSDIPTENAAAVQAICEATQSPRDVVYAMLKQCDFNLEEAAQKLIDEPFVEQRPRKKADKKSKDANEHGNGHRTNGHARSRENGHGPGSQGGSDRAGGARRARSA